MGPSSGCSWCHCSLGSGQVTVVWIQTLGDIGAIWRLRWGREILVKSDQMQRSQSNALKRGIGRGLFSQCLSQWSSTLLLYTLDKFWFLVLDVSNPCHSALSSKRPTSISNMEPATKMALIGVTTPTSSLWQAWAPIWWICIICKFYPAFK